MEMTERGGNGDGGFGFVELMESGEIDVGGFLNLEEGGGEDTNKEKNVSSYPQTSSLLPFACFKSNGRMIYFGGEEDVFVNGFPEKPNVKCRNDSPSSTSSSSSNNNCHSKHKKKGGNLCDTAGAAAGGRTGIGSGIQKKPRKEKNSNRNSGAKKEKMSDRIIKLQQLVSPFGKSDTASVLHEALCYIKFLHEQVQVLSSPYLTRLQSSATTVQLEGSKKDMRSRGLCLVPIERIAQVAGSNGADLWSPVMGNTAGDDIDPKH